MAAYSSPYEALRHEHRPLARVRSRTPTGKAPTTPMASTEDDTDSLTPDLPELVTGTRGGWTLANNDVLLHRVLDKSYRIQATPLNKGAQQLPQPQSTVRHHRSAQDKMIETPKTAGRTILDLDLDSSPMEEAPRLQSGVFDSPARKMLRAKAQTWQSQKIRERVPGVSVLTPRKPLASGAAMTNGKTGTWDSDSDEEDFLAGMSPPKTMQFHVPTNVLIQTPGKISNLNLKR